MSVESNILIREATVQDIFYIGDNMREDDIYEIWAAHKTTPRYAAMGCYLQKECLCVLVDDIPVILFGCADNDSFGVPWMLATDDIKKIGIQFILGSQEYVNRWFEQYKLLTNYVHAHNKVSIRWLKWLKFNFLETVLVNGEEFIRFEKKEE
jgi:hypothetical protein